MRKMFTMCVLSVEGFLPFLDGIQVISSKTLLPQGNIDLTLRSSTFYMYFCSVTNEMLLLTKIIK